ncbi:MAG: UvrB/UvrC motif-containing protein [Planctomycetota bacterium]
MKKCKHCEKPATFHITELTDPAGPEMLHLCEEHARVYLSQESDSESSTTLANMLSKHLKMEQSAEDLAELDKKSCPICGITFSEFRKEGRLGCANDYVCFQEDLEPLLKSIHGGTAHHGKRPTRDLGPDRQSEIIQLRRDMQEAVEKEQYELAGEIRDRIHEMENTPSEPQSSVDELPPQGDEDSDSS